MLLAVCAVPGGVEDARAQASLTLVSNLDRVGQGVDYTVGGGGNHKARQQLTTGPHTGGYVLESVTVELYASTQGSFVYNPDRHSCTGSDLVAEIRGAGDTYTLTAPGSFPSRHVRLTAPAGVVLAKNTDYTLYLSCAADSEGLGIGLQAADSDQEAGLPGFSIRDFGERTVRGVWRQVPGGGAFQIDVKGVPVGAPRITSITAVSDPGTDETYAIGDVVQATVTFDEAVTVNTAGGTPALDLDIGGVSKAAAYASGSGSTEIVFEYAVEEGVRDRNGFAVHRDSLELNGGTMRKQGTAVDALRIHADSRFPGHKVDGVKPSVVEFGAVVAADGATVALMFNEALASTSPVAGSFTLKVDGTEVASGISGVALSDNKVTLTLANTVTGSQTVAVGYTDPSAGDDANALEDLVGNEAESFADLAAVNTAAVPVWALSLSAAEITEGGAAVTVTVEITNSVTYSTDQTVVLEWGGASLAEGLIRGPNDAGTVTLTAGDTSVAVSLTAPDDATGLAYSPPTTADLIGTIGMTDIEVGSAALTYVDNDAKPEVSISATSTEAVVAVEEGEAIGIVATLAYPVTVAHTVGPLSATDTHHALGTPVPAEFAFAANEVEASVTVPTDDDSPEPGDRQVTFTLGTPSATAPVRLGTPASLTVTVRDNDAPPSAPRNVRATAGHLSVTLWWDEPSDRGGGIGQYRYRLREDGGDNWEAWTDIPGGGAARSHPVPNLANGTEYTFVVRAVGTASGNGVVSDQVKQTPFDTTGAQWTVSLSSQTIVEGGTVTATVRYARTQNFPQDVNVALQWGGAPLTSGRVVGESNATNVVVAANESGAELVLTAPGDHVYGGAPLTRPLAARVEGVVVAEADLTWRDDEAVPVASIAASPSTVTEGASFDLMVLLSELLHDDVANETIHVTTSGDTGALAGTVPGAWTVDPTDSTRLMSVATADDSAHDGVRRVTFTLTRSPRSLYALEAGTSSVTVTVLDNDALPGAPRNLAAFAGDTGAALAWAAPASHGDTPITKYQYRASSDGGLNWGTWTDVPGGDGHTRRGDVTGLTNDTEYTFEVQAVNGAGAGPASNQAVVTPASTAVANTWELVLSSATITEGGDRVTATVRLASGPTFEEDQTIRVTWDDCAIGPDSEFYSREDVSCVTRTVKGIVVDAITEQIHFSSEITIAAGARSGSLVLSAPDTNASYNPITYATSLVATLGTTEIGTEALTWVDDDPKPTAWLEAAKAVVNEGDDIELTIRFSNSSQRTLIRYDVTAGTNSVQTPVPGHGTRIGNLIHKWNLGNTHSWTIKPKDLSAVTGSRDVGVAISHHEDPEDQHVTLVEPTAVTVTVLDRDTSLNAPRNFSVEPANGSVVLSWDAPDQSNGAAVEKYQYRQSTDNGVNWDTWTDIPDGPDRGTDARDETTYTVTGLTNGTAYTFQVQASNRAGGGTETVAMTATPVAVNWSFSLTSDTITEGGGTVTAELASNGVTFTEDQTFVVSWAGAPVDANNLVQGANGATTIVIGAGQTSGTLVLTAPDNPKYPEGIYRPDAMETVGVSRGGAEIGTADLTLVDNEPKPQATIAADGAAVTEGDRMYFTATLTGKVSVRTRVSFTVTDADSALSSTGNLFFTFGAGQVSKRRNFTATDNTTADGSREVGLTLAENPDFPHYTLGTPGMATVVVLDDETVPGAPRNLRGEPGNRAVGLFWDAPAAAGGPVEKYQYRVSSDRGDNWGDWTDVPGEGTTTGYTLGDLDAGSAYTFEVWALNGTGPGDASNQVTETPASALQRPWSLTVSPSTLNEGGGAVTVTVGFTGRTFDTDQAVALEFGGELVGGTVAPGALVQAANGASYITIPTLQRSGSLELSLNREDDSLFSPPAAYALVAVHGGAEVASADLVLVDDEALPVLDLEATRTTVTEGDDIEITARLRRAFAEDTEVVFHTADADGVLSGTPAAAFDFTAGEATSTQTFATTDDSSAESAATVVFTAAERAGVYVLGTAPSATVIVLDNDSKPGAPRGFTAGSTGQTSIGLGWDAPTTDLVTYYEYRQREVGGAWGAWTRIANSGDGGANRTSFEVTGLGVQPYEFELRAVNANGRSPEASPVTASTVVVQWAFTVTSSRNSNGNPQVVEGGATLTVEARITNGATFDAEQQVKLFLDGTQVGGTEYPGSVLEGTAGVHVITIEAGASSGELEVRAHQDDLYLSRVEGVLEGRFFTTSVGSDTISYLDDEPVPVASIRAAPATVTEGDDIAVTVTTTQAALLGREFPVQINDAPEVLTRTATSSAVSVTSITIARGETTATESYATVDDSTAATVERSVAFTLPADPSASHHYALDAAASSATVVVLDDDAAPVQPQNLGTTPGEDRVTLSWDAPAVVEVVAYQVRHRTSGANAPAWSDGDWTDVTVTTRADGRLEHTVGNLTISTTYDFQVRGVNGFGNGAPGEATAPTIVIEWTFTVSPSAGPADARTAELVEGGSPITATATITNAETTPGLPLASAIEIPLTWCGEPLGDAGADPQVTGDGGAEGITIPADAPTGSLTIRAPADAAAGATAVHYPPKTCSLAATFAGEAPSVELTRTDAAPAPVARFAAATAQVVEGDVIMVDALLTTAYGPGALGVALEVTDAGGVLFEPPTHLAFDQFESATTTSVATNENTTAEDRAREVVLRMTADADEPYRVGTPASVTVVVLDDDAMPAAPVDLRGEGDNDRITLSWAPPPVQVVTGYEYRYRVMGTSAWAPDWGPVTRDDEEREGGRIGFTVENLTVGATYDFEVRGVNGVGNGAEASVTETTVVLEWGFTVTSPRTNANGNPEVVEGGATLTVRAEITNGVTLSTSQEVALFVELTPVGGTGYPGSALEGVGGVHVITIEAGTLSGELEVRARGDDLFYPLVEAKLGGMFHDTEVGSQVIGYRDDEPVPVLSIAAAPATVTEGGGFAATVTATQAYASAASVEVTTADAAGVLSGTPALAFEFSPGATSAIQDYTTAQDTTAATAARSVVITLRPEDPSLGHWYTYDAEASSATVVVLDDDAAPVQPQNLGTTPGEDRVTLSWDAPAVVEVVAYQVRHRTSGANAPAWSDGDWADVTVTTRADGRLEHTVGNLMVGATYDFQVRGVNGFGNGAPAEATAPTIVIEWTFSVSPSAGPADAMTAELVEGGGPITATATITNAETTPGLPLASAIEIPLTWCGEPLGDAGADPQVTGDGGAERITIPADALTGSLTIRAPADAAAGATAVHYPPRTCSLAATFAGEAPSVELTRTDVAPAPVARFAAATAQVVEGDVIVVDALLTTAYGPGALGVALEVTDAGGVLFEPPTHLAFDQFESATTTSVATNENTTAEDRAREVTLRMTADADEPYRVGTPASVRVVVLDDDAVPAAPVDLRGEGDNDRITLSWAPPPVQVVTGYEYRYRVTGTSAWAPDWGPVTRDDEEREGGRIGFTVENLTVGVSYDFEVHGVNDLGMGAPASVTADTVVIDWTIAVADARVAEGRGAELSFRVTLDRTAALEVTVDYATADGTARAGADYIAASGTLTFPVGETAKTVNVEVLADAHDEGEETLTLTLSNPSYGELGDAEASGTIEDSSPIPKAWLARFGRIAADHVVEALAERFDGAPDGGSHVTLGGRRLSLDGGAGGDLWTRWEESRPGDDWLREPGGEETRPTTERDLLLESSFHLANSDESEGAGTAATRWTGWGRASSSRFDAEADGLSLDGDVTSFVLGADVAREGWLAGVAVSLGRGDGGYRDRAGGDRTGRGSGTLKSSLAAVHPYARLEVSERWSVWGMLGYGTGELALDVDGGDRWRTGTGMGMAAAGARGVLKRAPESGGFNLGVRTDAQLVRMTSDAATGSDGDHLAAAEAETSRLRIMLEGSRAFAFGGGSGLTPSFEVGIRRDGGDAETGIGVEVGAGLRYTAPMMGVSVDAEVRKLVSHEDRYYSETGASGSVRIEPDASGRGLSLTLSPVWGAGSGGVERLWSARDARGLAANETFEAGSRLEAEVGYGFSVLDGRGVVTPLAGLTRSAESETLRLGKRLKRGASEWRVESEFGQEERTLSVGYGHRSGRALDFNLEAVRREPAGGGAPEHGVLLRARMRW